MIKKVQNNIFLLGKLIFFWASKTWGRSARMGKCLQKLMSVPAVVGIFTQSALPGLKLTRCHSVVGIFIQRALPGLTLQGATPW